MKAKTYGPSVYPTTPLQTSIFSVNHQIHSETSHIMYSEVVLMLYPWGLVCLRPVHEDIELPSEGTWRHNPLNGIGMPGPSGGRIYERPEMDSQMEPHVFCRFKQIKLELSLEFLRRKPQGYRPLWIDSELNVDPQDRAKFLKLLRPTNILRDFTEVISNSPNIRVLQITLEISAIPARNENLENDDGSLPEKYFMAVDKESG